MGAIRNIPWIFCMMALIEFNGLKINAQTTFSPYSMFGIGELEYGEYGRNSGMAGVSIGIQNPNFLNNSNPASFSALDSMTFLYDFAASAKWSTFSSNGITEKAQNAGLKRVVMGFRIARPWSLGFGMVPFSSVGYKIKSSQAIEGTDGLTIPVSYEGSGGINNFFLTNAFLITPKISVGINTSFLIGSIFGSELINNWSIEKTSSVKKIHFDFGVQYATDITKKINCIVGFIYGYNASLDLTNSISIINDAGSLLKNETTAIEQQKLPMFYGAGVSTSFNSMLTLAVDYQFYKTSVLTSDFPGVYFNDSYKLKFGAEYKTNRGYYNNYFQKIHYQTGFTIGKSYLTINGTKPITYGVCAGLVLPIKNSAFFNLSVEVGKTGSAVNFGQIQENYTKLNFNITFRDLWFLKHKYD
jgi:hypothetical protein